MKKIVTAWIVIVALAAGILPGTMSLRAEPEAFAQEALEAEVDGQEPVFPDTEADGFGSASEPEAFAGPVFSEDTVTEGDWSYQVADGKAGIVHYDGTDTAVAVPDSLGGYPVVFIGALTFAGEYVEISGLGGYYQSNDTIVSLQIPASVTDFKYGSLDYLDALESIQVDGANGAYASQDGVLFSKDMRTVYRYPHAKKKVSYTLPDSVEVIQTNCFDENPYVQSLDFNHAKEIVGVVVYRCDALERVDLGDACEVIRQSVIRGCKVLREIQIPAAASVLLVIMEACPAVSSLKVEKGSQHYCSVDNIVFSKDKTELVRYAPNRPGRAYTVPDTVLTIARYSFIGMQNLEELLLSKNTSLVEFEAIYSSKLKKITIPNPDCRLGRDAVTIMKTAAIYGYKPSGAYDYAVEHGCTFVDLESGGTDTNEITFEGMLRQVPLGFDGEPTYQTTDVIHEADTSRKEYVELKQFTDTLVKGCATDYEKAERISQWVNGHITYELGKFAGNTIESVYMLFYDDAPKGNCMAYTRLAAYMLYLAGIPTLEVINADHEWCMAYIGGKWLIIDATNNIITEDYSKSLYASPRFLSFSQDGNIYAVKNNKGVYLMGVHYGQLGAASASRVTFADYVTGIDEYAFLYCPNEVVVTCSSRLEREMKKAMPCVKKAGDQLTAWKKHQYGGWSYVGDSSEMERFCSRCKSRETMQGTVFPVFWMGKKSYTDIVGSKIRLTTYCTSKAKISYKSANSKVASVSSDGTVTLKGAGTAKIILSVKAKNGHEASECAVTVKAVDLGEPIITKFKASSPGQNGSRVNVTISWKKARNADGYYVCYGTADDRGYGMSQVKEDGKKTKTFSFTVSSYSDTSNKFWVEAYKDKEDVSSVSAYKFFNQAAVSLSKKSYSYDGKAKKPSAAVKIKGRKLKKGKDYTVSYSGNKNIGTAKVTVKLKGNYGGKLSASFKICPPKTELSSVKKSSSGTMAVKWKKNKHAGGYQLQYAQNRGFTIGKKTYTISGAKNCSRKISRLAGRKSYYLRIRAYKKVSGKNYYSAWSAVKRARL